MVIGFIHSFINKKTHNCKERKLNLIADVLVEQKNTSEQLLKKKVCLSPNWGELSGLINTSQNITHEIKLIQMVLFFQFLQQSSQAWKPGRK